MNCEKYEQAFLQDKGEKIEELRIGPNMVRLGRSVAFQNSNRKTLQMRKNAELDKLKSI